MKTIKYFLSAALLTVASAASAQFTNSGSSSFGGSSASTDDYKRFKVSYDVQTFSYDGDDADDDLKGVSLEFLYGKSISSTMPLFLEYGGNLTWGYFSDGGSKYEVEKTINTVSFTVPVNLVYKLALNDEITIEPHVGIGFRLNLLGTSDVEVDYDGDSNHKSISFFDKDDTENTWNRFQLCGQLGAGICFKQYYFGYEYSMNFSEIAKKTEVKTHYFSVGINF